MLRRSRWSAGLRAGLAVGVLALGACGGSSDSDETTTSGDAATSGDTAASGDTIVIENFKFSPTPLSAKAGATITVENKDGVPHTLTADDKSVDTGNIEGKASGSVVVPQSGTVAYHCEVHDYMKGVIRVEA